MILCRPTTYPHPGAYVQWESLKAKVSRNCALTVIEPLSLSPDSVYCRDVGFKVDESTFLRARFRKRSRRGETSSFLNQVTYNRVLSPPCWTYFEGGDVRRVNSSTVVCGYGIRTNFSFTVWMRKALDIDVIDVRLVDKKAFHLDLCLSVFNEQSAIIVKTAFSPHSLQKLESRFPDHLFLDIEDMYACNGLLLRSSYIVSHSPPHVQSWLRRRGVNVVLVDCSEFHKEDGGVHCLTQN